MRKCVKAIACLVLLVGMTGCTVGAPQESQPNGVQKSGTASRPIYKTTHGVVDPLSEITDKYNSEFVSSSVGVVLHKSGKGPTAYPVSITQGTPSVRAYIACSPESKFTVRIGKRFSGTCASTFQNFADIPPQNAQRVNVEIPSNTNFTILVISTPSQ